MHISREGIFVKKDHKGNDVEISKDGVVLDGRHIMSKEEAKRRARKKERGRISLCRCGDGGISCAGLRLLFCGIRRGCCFLRYRFITRR